MPRPMPEAAPVTRAVSPFNKLDVMLSSFDLQSSPIAAEIDYHLTQRPLLYRNVTIDVPGMKGVIPLHQYDF